MWKDTEVSEDHAASKTLLHSEDRGSEVLVSYNNTIRCHNTGDRDVKNSVISTWKKIENSVFFVLIRACKFPD